MKNFVQIFKIESSFYFIIVIFILLASACSKEKKEVTDESESSATQEVQDSASAQPITTSSKMEYRQSKNDANTRDKLVINAGELSFKSLNKDNNHVVDKEELYSGLYSLLDSDQNNELSEAEFNKEQNFLIKDKQSKFSSLMSGIKMQIRKY